MVDSRAAILRSIRLALAKPAHSSHDPKDKRPVDMARLFRSASAKDHLVEKFQQEFEAVSGEFFRASGADGVADCLCGLIQNAGVGSVAVSDHPLCNQLQVKEGLETKLPDLKILKEIIDSQSTIERRRLKSALAQTQLSVTGAEFLVAESGTVGVIAGSHASRQISLLPAIHVVVATPRQIFPNLLEAFQTVQQGNGSLPGSALTLITGPSRTADIEKVLIKGVHGPTRIVTIMVEA